MGQLVGGEAREQDLEGLVEALAPALPVDFEEPDTIETYSSRGPTPDDRVKPDLVAADCTTTSIINPFCGTSESSPYVTGAAALVIRRVWHDRRR